MNNQVVLKQAVLFLCTGNSCRSQMAEAMVNWFLGERWVAFSAGTFPSGYVHPLALRALAEITVPTAGLRSKSTGEFRQQPLDLVITVCDEASENCPLWLGQGQLKHISFPDPAKVAGTDEEKMVVFRQLRDDMRGQLLSFLGEFS